MTDVSELISKQIDKIPSLRNLPSSQDPQFKSWEQLTKTIFLNTLGGKKWQDFSMSCDFWPNTVGPWDDYELIKSLNSGLDSAEAFLKTTLEEIEIFGIVSQNKTDEPSIPSLKFGENGKNGRPGNGGSVFIQAQNFTVSGNGKISADGGDYIVHQNELNNFGTINQVTAETINNITKLTHVVSQSELDEIDKRQLIGDIETIKAQIVKPKPNKTILQKAWDAVQIASTIGGAAQLLGMIGSVVLPLLK